MGIKEFFFGESPSQDITPTSKLSPNQQGMEDALAKIFEGGGIPGSEGFSFEGNVGTERGSLTNTSLEALEQQALQRNEGGFSEEEQAALDFLVGTIEGGPQDYSERYNAFESEATRTLTEDTLPLMDRKFASKFFSEDRRGAEEDIFEDFSDNLTNTRADLNYAANRDFFEDAFRSVGAIGDIESTASNILQTNVQADAIPREIDSREAMNEFEVWKQKQQQKDQRIQQMIAAMNINSNENIVFNNPGSEGLVPGLIKSAGSAYAGGFGNAAGTKWLSKR